MKSKNTIKYKKSGDIINNVKVFINTLPKEAIDIRTKVFVIEQGFKEEFDTVDNTCVHFLYFVDNKAIGVARLYNSEEHNCLSIGRFAVLKEYRNQGIGRKLLEFIEKFVLDNYGHTKIGLSSQKRAIPFYSACGYQSVGDFYLDEDYPHIFMEKNI